MKHRSLITIAAIVAFTASAFDRSEFTDKVLKRGKELHKTVASLNHAPQKHPSKFNFRGTDAQKKAAYAAQLKRYNDWKAQYAPAVRDKAILSKAYAELKRCTDSRAQDIAVELSGIFEFQPVKSIDGIYGSSWIIRNGKLYHQTENWSVDFEYTGGIKAFNLGGGPRKGETRYVKIQDGIMFYGGSANNLKTRYHIQENPFASIEL